MSDDFQEGADGPSLPILCIVSAFLAIGVMMALSNARGGGRVGGSAGEDAARNEDAVEESQDGIASDDCLKPALTAASAGATPSSSRNAMHATSSNTAAWTARGPTASSTRRRASSVRQS